ncbi:hypothetical protein P3W45_001097 [Vairimorpha bombi]|jgi:flap endonuclease-1
MGIKQLSQLLKENCKKGIKEKPIQFYSFKKIGIDTSMFIYQFLIAVRADGNTLGVGDNTTSHIVGMLYRTIRLVESGIIPIFIFDGKPPEMKMYELKKRTGRREKADEDLKKAEELEDKALIEKHEKRKVKVNEEHVNDCKKLLTLLGIPYLTAPSEAEAFCAYLCKKKFIHGVATEDMDALTFGSPILLRNFTASATKKLPIIEYNLELCLKELDIDMPSFIDLCILLGCDYTESLKGIGMKRGLSLIKKHGSIENILKNEKIELSETFEYEKARDMFSSLSNIEVEIDQKDFSIKWDQVNLEEIKAFLVTEKKFDEIRVVKGVEKFLSFRNRSKQSNLDSFFAKK